MTTKANRSFSKGEVSPSMYARVDTIAHSTGLRTLRNMQIMKPGGVMNRPGTTHIQTPKYHDKLAVFTEFVLGSTRHVLEVGENYIRVFTDEVVEKESEKSITSIAVNPGDIIEITKMSHGYQDGDHVYIYDVGGMTEINNRTFIVANKTPSTFELQDTHEVNIDAADYSTYTSGGSMKAIYEVTTTYAEADLRDLSFSQNGSDIIIANKGYRTQTLTRASANSWTISDTEFAPTTATPTDVVGTSGATGPENYYYVVTAIDKDTGAESLPGVADTWNLSAITQADPPLLTTTATHGLVVGQIVTLSGITGMTEMNGQAFVVASTPSLVTFTLEGISTVDFTAYVLGGEVALTEALAKSGGSNVAVADSTNPVTVSWTAASNAQEYNVYKKSTPKASFGLIGIARVSTGFADVGQTPDTSIQPPISRNVFVGDDNYPATVGVIQQRLALGSSVNDERKISLSKIGAYFNFNTTVPLASDDPVIFTLRGSIKTHSIKHIIDIGKPVVLTDNAIWSLEGDAAGAITPTAVNPNIISSYGSNNVLPVPIAGRLIYVHRDDAMLRDLDITSSLAGVKEEDLTIVSDHLFRGKTIVDMVHQESPHSILWCVMSDGALLGLTYLREQSVLGWHRHDFQGGKVKSVAALPASGETKIYLLVERTINNLTTKSVEYFSNRDFTSIKDAKLLDANLSYDGVNTSATTMTLSGGTNWTYDEDLTLTASTSYFASTDVGNRIDFTATDGSPLRCTITAYTSATVVTVRAHKTVPSELQSTATAVWTKAVDVVTGLWHLEGEAVSVFADGFVEASPNNAAYDTITVTDGSITLGQPYGTIHVGLPYFSDIETLDIDVASENSISDVYKNVSKVNMFVEDTRGVWAGPRPPSSDTTDPLENLEELKIRDEEDYESPVSLTTDVVDITIIPEWNSNGRVFIRQVDPVPMTILSINPSGNIPGGS